MTAFLWTLSITLLAAGAAFWVGVRVGRIRVVSDELDVLRARTLRPPREIVHMASNGIPKDVEARVREAFAIANGERGLRPTVDHLTALILLHADAMDHYDRLGDLTVGHRAAQKRAEAARDQLARWIARSVNTAAERGAQIDAITRPPAKKFITFVELDKHGKLNLGSPN